MTIRYFTQLKNHEKVDRLRARRSEDTNYTASDTEFTAPMELKNKEKRKLLRDIKYQSAELRETGDVQSNSQVNFRTVGITAGIYGPIWTESFEDQTVHGSLTNGIPEIY